MIITFENILFIGSFLLGISILVGKTSFRLGVPALILFIIVGMLAGSEGSGGLETRWESTRPVVWHGLTLSTVALWD